MSNVAPLYIFSVRGTLFPPLAYFIILQMFQLGLIKLSNLLDDSSDRTEKVNPSFSPEMVKSVKIHVNFRNGQSLL